MMANTAMKCRDVFPLPLELIANCIQFTHDPHVFLYLESVNRDIRAAHLPLPGRCETTVGHNWSHDIRQVNRLAALHRKLDRLQHLAMHIDTLPEQFFQPGRCSRMEHLELIDVQSVPASVEHLCNLHELRLEGNFTKLPDAIGNCQALQHLSIKQVTSEWMHCFRLPETLGRLVNLETLHLQVDGAVKWPESASALTALTSLTLHCLRTDVQPCSQEGLPRLPALCELHIRTNDLSGLELTHLLNPTLQLLDICTFSACTDLLAILQRGAQQIAQQITNLAKDSCPASKQQLQQLLQQQDLQLSQLKTLRLVGCRTGLSEYAAAEELAAQHPSTGPLRLPAQLDKLLLHPLCRQHPSVAWLQDTCRAGYHYELQLESLFRYCLTAVTALEICLKMASNGNSYFTDWAPSSSPADRDWRAERPLYAVLSSLPQLQQLKLSGFQELPDVGSSSSSRLSEWPDNSICGKGSNLATRGICSATKGGGSCSADRCYGSFCNERNNASGINDSSCSTFAALTQLKSLDLQDCGSTNGSTSTMAASSSSSTGSDEVQLPVGLTGLRFVRCAAALPWQQLLSKCNALQHLVVDSKAVAGAGHQLQLLAARGCEVQVED